MRDCSHVISPFKWAFEQVRDYSPSFEVGTPTKRSADALVLVWAVQMDLLNLYGLFSVIFFSEFFSLIMHTYPRKCTCIRQDDLRKKKFPGEPSRVLKWEYKTFKLKSIDCRFWSRLGLCMKSCKM